MWQPQERERHPGVEHGHGLEAEGRGAADVHIELAELLADALDVVDELRELAGELEVAAVAYAVYGLAQYGAAGRDPVLLRLADGVAAGMEGVREEIRQEAAFGVLDAGDVAYQPERRAVADGADDGVEADALELVQIGLGAYPVVAEEHHGFLAQLVSYVDHFPGERGHLAALEGHEVLVLLRWHAVLVVVVALVDDELGAEPVANLALELLEYIGADAGRIAVPVDVLLALELVEDERELVEEGGVAYDVHVGVLRDEAAQALHGELVRLGLADVEGYLVLEVCPAVGDGVVHMHRVPYQVGEEAHGVVVEVLGPVDYDGAALLVPAPRGGVERLARRAVHDLPPALYLVAGVDLEELGADALHELYRERPARGGAEAGGDIALLHLVGVRLCPGVILAGGVIRGVDLGVHALELLGIVGAVAVAYGVGAPALEQFEGFGDYVHVGGDGDPSPVALVFAHGIPPALQRLSSKGLL